MPHPGRIAAAAPDRAPAYTPGGVPGLAQALRRSPSPPPVRRLEARSALWSLWLTALHNTDTRQRQVGMAWGQGTERGSGWGHDRGSGDRALALRRRLCLHSQPHRVIKRTHHMNTHRVPIRQVGEVKSITKMVRIDD